VQLTFSDDAVVSATEASDPYLYSTKPEIKVGNLSLENARLFSRQILNSFYIAFSSSVYAFAVITIANVVLI